MGAPRERGGRCSDHTQDQAGAGEGWQEAPSQAGPRTWNRRDVEKGGLSTGATAEGRRRSHADMETKKQAGGNFLEPEFSFLPDHTALPCLYPFPKSCRR